MWRKVALRSRSTQVEEGKKCRKTKTKRTKTVYFVLLLLLLLYGTPRVYDIHNVNNIY